MSNGWFGLRGVLNFCVNCELTLIGAVSSVRNFYSVIENTIVKNAAREVVGELLEKKYRVY